MNQTRNRRYVIWALVVLLIILHQDNWLWDNQTLVFGFMPITLLFHAGISLAAGVVWFLATRFAWPDELEHVEPVEVKGGDA